jgi:hypothetical protein
MNVNAAAWIESLTLVVVVGAAALHVLWRCTPIVWRAWLLGAMAMRWPGLAARLAPMRAAAAASACGGCAGCGGARQKRCGDGA